MTKKRDVHPYIPNSVPEAKQQMLGEIGASDPEELYAEMIPDRLRLKGLMKLPEPLLAEYDLKRHMESILSKNKTCIHCVSFLGADCWQHYVPAVCDEIAGRSEFLTVYDGEPYSDLGRYQAFFEFQSMMGELLEMEVVGLPTYDWGAAAGNAIRMASRITNRREVLVPRLLSPSRMSIISNFCRSATSHGNIRIKTVEYDFETGTLDHEDFERKISSQTAAVYFENPSYIGVIEPRVREFSKVAHEYGAKSIVGVDPISLGVLAPPGDYGADIVCGEAQPLGIHMYCGGSLCGFLACRDEERYVAEHPSLLISITETEREGEHGFGYCRFDRTSYHAREKAKDWVGTATALWTVVGAVYMALMGPVGMKELGEAIIQKSHYAAKLLSQIHGIRIRFPSFFKQFVVDFHATDMTVSGINKALLNRGIFGGKDITKEFPELGKAALYSVTEMHTKQDLDELADALRDVVK